jgi:hypothetical protein
MKKMPLFAFALLAIATLFSATSCQKIKDAVASNVNPISWDQGSIPLTIPASASTSQQTAFGTVHFDLDQYIKEKAPSGVSIGYSAAKHIYLQSFDIHLDNADGDNNFSNLDFTPDNAPALIFNTTPNPTTAIQFGGTWAMPASPYTDVTVPVSNNNDLKTISNGTDWAYGLTYKLLKPMKHDVKATITAHYQIAFK